MKLLQHTRWLFWNEPHFNLLFIVTVGVACGIGAIVSPPATIAICIILLLSIWGKFASKPLTASFWLIGFIVLGSAMERGKFIPQLAPNEFMLLVVFALSALYAITHSLGKPISITILFGTFILTLGTSVVPILSYYLRDVSLSFQTMFMWVAPVQYLLIFWIFSTIPRTQHDRIKVLQVMFFCATIVSVIGLMQAARVPFILDFLVTWYPSSHTEAAAVLEGSGVGRITSVFGAWNTTGTFMMVNLLCLTALQNTPVPKNYKINMLISAILSLLTLVASGSYASLGGFILGFIIIKTIDPRGLKDLMPLFIVIALGIILLFPVISDRFLFQFGSSDGGIIPNTLAYRFKIWGEIYIPLIAENPIWGAVPNFDNLSFAYADSQYIDLVVSRGLVSLVAFVVWLVLTLAWLLDIIRRQLSPMRMLALATLICFLLLTVMGITNPVFTYSGVMDYLWIYLGLIAGSLKDKLHVAY